MIYPWIFVGFFLHLPALLLSAEVDTPTQKNVTEALQTIGKFMRDNSATNWLSSLATKQSTPLTTEDLMNEILNSSKVNETVKNAANIVKLALDEQKQHGNNKTSLLEFDGWKDMIDNVENKNDIVCLYRTSYNVSSEQSDNWEKFLTNFTSEYTIYLALDMGQKIVTCLKKKINESNQNIISRNLDKINDTDSNLMDSSTRDSTISGDNVRPNGSRSMTAEDKSVSDTDKCDSSDAQTDNDDTARIMPTNFNFARRTLPIPNPVYSDAPCNRPIIFMLPPNYGSPTNYYNAPIWPRNTYQTPSNPSRLSSMPYYAPRYIPNSRVYSPVVYSNSIDKYRQAFEYSRKQLPVTPRATQFYDLQNNRNRINPYSGNRLLNTPYQPTSSYQRPFVPPLARSLSHPSPPKKYKFDQGYRQLNYGYPPYQMPPQVTRMRPLPVQYSPPSLLPPYQQPNCVTCPNPCERPILLKVLLENPLNQPVKIGLMHNEEYDIGRRRMNDKIIGREIGNLNEKIGETGEGSGDKETG